MLHHRWGLILATVWGSEAQIRILSPASLQRVFAEGGDRESPNGVITASTATFGAPTYGNTLVGKLLLIKSASCKADYESQLLKDYNITTESQRIKGALKNVFLIPRGNCSFVKKVAVAESLGADAVIIMDSPDSPWTRRQIAQVILSDDGNGQGIKIPSVLVEKKDGEALALAASKAVVPLINMEWSLPQAYLVRTDFWTSSGSREANKFLKAMKPIVQKLKGFVHFRPHYFILRLKPELKDDESVVSMCYQGNIDLCAPPPDSGSAPITSADVMQENLRQLCLLKLYSHPVSVKDPDYEGEVTFSQTWWDYIELFQEECPLKVVNQISQKKFGLQCSEGVMKMVGADPIAVENCVQEQGLALLENERDNNAWGVLSLRVNDARFSGNLDPALVLKAMCSAFEKEPYECGDAAKIVWPPTTVIHSHYSLAHTFAIMVALGTTLAGLFYLYQYYQQRGLRNTMRHEVMLEVKSQLQDWYRVDDPSMGVWNELGSTQGRNVKETEFAHLKFRT